MKTNYLTSYYDLWYSSFMNDSIDDAAPTRRATEYPLVREALDATEATDDREQTAVNEPGGASDPTSPPVRRFAIDPYP